MSACTLEELSAYLEEALAIQRYPDYAENGVQVAGKFQIQRLALGVCASLAVIEAAADWGADLLLVHHGLFWQGEPRVILPWHQPRLQRLFEQQMSLLAYHLPLDAHPTWGNNAMLAQQLELPLTGWLPTRKQPSLVAYADLDVPLSVEELNSRLSTFSGFLPTWSRAGNRELLSRIAWCTGGGQNYFPECVHRFGVEAFITGEASLPAVHLARECNVHYFAAGHHATERFGVQALGQHLSEQFGLTVQFFDEDIEV